MRTRPILPYLGPALRRLRGQRTLEALAAAIQCSPEELAQFEAGTTHPELDTLERLLEALDIPLARLSQEVHTVQAVAQLRYALDVVAGVTPAASEEEELFCQGLVVDMSWRLAARRQLNLPELATEAGRPHASAA